MNIKRLIVFCFLIRVWWISWEGHRESGIALWMPTASNGPTVDVCPDRGGDVTNLPLKSIIKEQEIRCQCIRCLGDAPQFGCKGKSGKARR